MPQPIVYQADQGLVQGINQAGGALAQALAQRNIEQKKLQKEEKERERYKQSGGVLNEMLSALPQDTTPEQYQNALTLAIQKGVPLELIKQASDLYKPILQERAKQSGAQNFFNSIFGNQADIVPAMSQMTISPMGQTSFPMDQGSPAYELPNSQITPSMLSGMEPPVQQTQPQQRGFDITTTSMDNLMKLMASPYKQHQNLAEAEIKRRDMDHKRFVEDRKYHSEGAKAAEKKAMDIRESIPRKKMALSLARDAIESKEIGAFSLNNLSERMGVPELKTAKGAQLITAGKENLLSNMSRVSAKGQNQWFEQRLNSMFPTIGQSEEANETIQLMLEGELAMDEAYLNAYNKLANEDQKKYGYIRRDIDQRAHEITDVEDQKIMDRTSYKLREVYEREKGARWMIDNAVKKVPNGTILTPQMAKVISLKYDGDFKKAIENAKKLGYRIPTRQQVQQWQ